LLKLGGYPMDDKNLRRDLFLLVGYLLTSAHGLYGEPKGYGPFRLMDAAGRLLAIMQACELADPFLNRLQRTIDAERFGHGDDDTLQITLNELCLEYAAELKQRASLQEEES
jgi:hypothetical protein